MRSQDHVGVGGLLGSWFPEKKGVASGYASIGIPASSATSVAAFTFLFSRFGFSFTMAGVSVILLCLSFLTFLLLRDTPAERGVFPDGIAPEEKETNAVPRKEETGSLSLRQMLGIREMWLTGIILGLFCIATTGVMGQFVIRHTQAAFSKAESLELLTVCAVVGLVGSPIMGKLENKLGSVRGFLVCCSIFITAMLLNFTNVHALIFVSIACLGVVITGMPIFMTSFLVTIFGTKNFKTAYAIAYPLSSLIGQTTFLLTSLMLRIFGEIRFAYLLFSGLLIIAMVLTKFLCVPQRSSDRIAFQNVNKVRFFS